jgi:hypothetical protein
MKRAIVREATVGQEKVTVRMPLNQVSGRDDGDDDAGPSVRADLSAHVLGDGLGGALGEVEQKLPPSAASGYPWSARLKALLPIWLAWAKTDGSARGNRTQAARDQPAPDRSAPDRRKPAAKE